MPSHIRALALAVSLILLAVSPVAAQVSAPALAPSSTPSADPLVLTLSAGDLGPTWSVVASELGPRQYDVQYFNNVVTHDGFRLATFSVAVTPDEPGAAALQEELLSSLQFFGYDMARDRGVGDGIWYRGVRTTERGLRAIVYAYHVERVAVTVSGAGMLDRQSEESIDVEVRRFATVQHDQIKAGLHGQLPVRPLPTLPAPSLTPDPSELVVSLADMNGAWMVDNEFNSGSPWDQARAHAHVFVDNVDFPAPRRLLYGVTLAPTVTTARVSLGMSVADWERQGVRFESFYGLGDDVAFQGLQTTFDDVRLVVYVYRVGPALLEVAASGPEVDLSGLDDQAWAAALLQQQRVRAWSDAARS